MSGNSMEIRNGRRGRGFTMAEVLIVVGIIALVTAIAAPSIAVARRRAKSVECLNNLRQMSVAAFAYAGHYGGSFPPAIYSVSAGGINYNYSWDYTIITRSASSDVKILPGLLWEGQGDLRIQQCPEFEGSAMSPNNPFTGYNYNTSYLGRGMYAGNTQFDPPARLSAVVDPSRTAAFGDGQYADGANKYMRSPHASPYLSDRVPRFAGTQGFRHSGRTNVSFVDGHAESIEARFVVGTLIADGTGFLSADNSMYDLK